MNTTENQLLREFVHAADAQDPLFDALGWIERARAALTHPAQPAEGGEATISTEHGPWLPSQYHEGETYCERCNLRSAFLGGRECKPHIVYTTPPVSQEKANWCEYVAGMVDHWVRTDEYDSIKADEDRCTKAIAGIIERRLWALKREAIQEQTHPDDAAVDKFAARMKWKLARARDKGRAGWQDPWWTPEQISQALREHVKKGDPLDVANYCMFLVERGAGIVGATPKPEPMTDPQLAAINPYRYSGSARVVWTNGFRAAERRYGITKGEA